MHTRRVIAAILQVVAILFSLLVWIDPLEGGAALFAVTLFSGSAWLIGRVRMPRWVWLSVLVTIAVGAAEIAILVSAASTVAMDGQTVETVTSSLPPAVMVLQWLWRAGAVVVAAGMIAYLVWILRELKASRI